MKASQKVLILDWMRKIHKMEWAHRYESIKWKNMNFILGITSLTLATIISAISTVPGINETLAKLIVSIGAIVVAILSGLLTFLKPSEVSENFKVKADEFESLRHELEEALEFELVDDSGENRHGTLEAIRNKWCRIGALNMSTKNFNKAGKTVRRLKRYPESLNFVSESIGEEPHNKATEADLKPPCAQSNSG